MGQSFQDYFGSNASRVAKSNGQARQASGSSSFYHYIRHGFELAQQLAKHAMAAAIGLLLMESLLITHCSSRCPSGLVC